MRTLPLKKWLFPLMICLLILLFSGAALADGAQISGTVYLDRDNDGIMQDSDIPIEKATVLLQHRLEDGTVQDLASKTVGKDGAFAFAVNQAGDYRLSFKLPYEYLFTLHGEGSCALPANSNKSVSPWFTLQNGDSREMNAGATKSKSSLVITAFVDSNANGGRANSEPFLKGVKGDLIYEYGGETYVIASITSDNFGVMSMRDLSPATYLFRVQLPDNYVIGPKGLKDNTWYNRINAREDGAGVSDPLVLEAGHSIAFSVGAVKTGSLEGNLWLDNNFNGRRDDGDGPLTQATVYLISPALDLTREATPDENGKYAFRNVQPGEYKVGVQLADGLVFTYASGSAISVIGSYGETAAYIEVEKTVTVKDVGAMQAARVSLRFFADDNLNGVWDEGEGLLPGVAVTVSQMGQTAETKQSGEDGLVSFSALRSGEATLDTALPDGYIFELNQTLDQGLFGIATATAADRYSGSVHLNAENENSYAADVAVTVPASIRGRLFEDPVNAGLFTDDCDLLAGFTVQAVTMDGQIMAQATTDTMGEYTLSPLHTGDFTVRFLLNDPYVASPQSSDNDIAAQSPAYGETASFALAQGQHAEGIDGAVFRAGTVEGHVRNALADDASGIRDVTVTLLDTDGLPVSDYTWSVSDETGRFLIKGVLPGEYTVRYELPETAALIDSDARETISASFSMTSGSQQQVADVQCIYTAKVRGEILQDAGEAVNARITLTSLDSGEVFETEAAKEDSAYEFALLRPGNYRLEVKLPSGCVFGQLADSPLPPKAADTNEISFVLAPQDEKIVSVRAAAPVEFSGEIYFDANISGYREDGELFAGGQRFSLWLEDACMLDAAADENGAFRAQGLVPARYTVRMPLLDNEVLLLEGAEQAEGVWQFEIDLNENQRLIVPMLRYAVVSGQVWNLDHTLKNVDQIEVTLLDESGQALGSILTNEDGEFGFSKLLPGVYSLSAKLPGGYLFAKEQDTSERASMIQSQADGAMYSIPFTVPMGKKVTGMDIGIGSIGKIGDKAWLDSNGNGMQDIGETGIPGIQIELYRNGELAASTATDLYGRYSLDNLYPGEYEMRVTMHSELKTTKRQTSFPLVASIMPESSDTTVSFSVIVPSGGANLHCDLGFQLRKDGVYPSVMNDIPAKDWTPYSQRTAQ